MIQVIAPGSEQHTANLLVSALHRSCGLGSASLASAASWQCPEPAASSTPAVFVVVHPREEWTDALLSLLDRRVKLILLGRLSTGLAQALGVSLAHEWPVLWAETTTCPAAPVHGSTESAAHVVYPTSAPRVANHAPALAVRPFRRYDYAAEWNNLGYGAITADGTAWSLSQHATAQEAHQIAKVQLGEQFLCSYAALWNRETSSVLWFNRAAGPIDSQEWRIVEDFLSCHRAQDLPCVPVLSEIPHGFDSAVTMRLDCDEDVESARALWTLYRSEKVPFSLALHSRVLSDDRHHHLPREVLAEGGALLSHTATHAPNWGGSYEAAFHEGRDSARAIESVTGVRVRYAVSPFHQTPDYARLGLADAGYRGCVGGIICNDPDFLTARAGMPPASGAGFIGHSQQCMLHGDCLLGDGDPLRIFKQAFDVARNGGAFFGYLDHPFSERYAYGWLDEAQRVNAHKAFIDHIRQSGGRICWANENDAMDFLSDRSQTVLTPANEGFRVERTARLSPWSLSVRYRGQTIRIEERGVL